MKSNNTRFSLKIKMALAVGALAALILVVQAASQLIFQREDQQALVGQQLDALVSQVARELDDKLALRQEAIVRAAGEIPLEHLDSPARMEEYLRSQSVLLTLVDDLYVFSPDGVLTVDWPPVQGRRQLNMWDREYIRRTVSTRQPVTSEPLRGRITRRPIIVMTAPILDRAGELKGIFAGVLNLYKPNILGDLRELRIGQSGYLTLVHPNRSVIMHPDSERLLQPVAAPGEDPLLDHALLSSAAPALHGVDQQSRQLVSHQRLHTTGWVLSGQRPLREAFVPIERMAGFTIALSLGLAVLVMPLIWLLAQRFMQPLEKLSAQIRSQRSSFFGSEAEPVVVSGSSEVRDLAEAFNEFIERNLAAERELRIHEERLSLVLETASDGIWDWDIVTNQLHGNQALKEMLGLHSSGPLITTPAVIAEHIFEGERAGVRNAIRDCLKGHTSMYRSEHRLRHTSGQVIWVLERGRVVERAPDGRALRMVGSFTDITAHKESEERIRQMAYYDALTGLPNRSLLAERINDAIIEARTGGHRIAVLFVDLDHFKNINDSLGHFTGDLLLQAVGQRLAHSVGERCLVARQGGDEFVILLNPARVDEAADLARQILRSAMQPFAVEGRLLSISPSVGVSVFPDDAEDFETLLRHADIAMYRAKAEGRNTYCFFTPEMNEQVCQRLELESAMREAIAQRQFSLCYQPQVDLGSGAIIGLEALARWQHPGLGSIPPNAFIPVAEDSGLIAPLGEWVLAEACRQARQLLDQGLPPLVMAVNLSAVQFRHPRLPETIAGLLATHRLPPSMLELELTEGVVMEDSAASQAMLQRLKGMGVRLAIDDFGTGYSSLGYLKLFPIDKLKIDRSFVRDLEENEQDQAISQAIIALAHTLGLSVLAEGVETPAQRHLLQSAGCDAYQGYLCAQPLTAAELADWLHHYPNPRPGTGESPATADGTATAAA